MAVDQLRADSACDNPATIDPVELAVTVQARLDRITQMAMLIEAQVDDLPPDSNRRQLYILAEVIREACEAAVKEAMQIEVACRPFARGRA